MTLDDEQVKVAFMVKVLIPLVIEVVGLMWVHVILAPFPVITPSVKHVPTSTQQLRLPTETRPPPQKPPLLAQHPASSIASHAPNATFCTLEKLLAN